MAKKYGTYSQQQIGTTKSNVKMDSGGVAYIVLPGDLERVDYINNCYRSGKVSILTEESQRYDNVPIGKHVVPDLIFPETVGALGSQVVWINIAKYNQPNIIAIIDKNDEVIPVLENQFSLKKEFKDNLVEVFGDAKTGIITIKTKGVGSNQSKLILNIENTDENGQLEVNVDGQMDINSKSTINVNVADGVLLKIARPNNDLPANQQTSTIIKYERETGLTYEDEFGTKFYINSDGKVWYKPKSTFEIDSENEEVTNNLEWMLLGESTKSEAEKLNGLVNAIVSVLTGPPIVEAGNGANSSLQTALATALQGREQADFTNVLSQVSKTK